LLGINKSGLPCQSARAAVTKTSSISLSTLSLLPRRQLYMRSSKQENWRITWASDSDCCSARGSLSSSYRPACRRPEFQAKAVSDLLLPICDRNSYRRPVVPRRPRMSETSLGGAIDRLDWWPKPVLDHTRKTAGSSVTPFGTSSHVHPARVSSFAQLLLTRLRT
jgi:hypothetical protein